MRIRLTKTHRRNGFPHRPGTILEANAATAAFLFRLGRAEPIDPNETPQPKRRRRGTQPQPTP